MLSALPPETGLLVTTERARRVKAVEGVRPNHAGLETVGNAKDLASLVAPDASGQPVRRVVGFRNGFRWGAEREYRKHRPEDLLSRDPVAGLHTGEDCRGEPEAVFRDVAGSGPALGSLGLTDVGQDADALKLFARIDRADVRVLVERIAEAQRLQTFLEPVNYFVVHVLLHQKTAPCTAHVALVEEDSVHDALDRLVHRRIVEHNVGGLSSKLEGQLLSCAGRRPGNGAANRS